MPSSTGARKRSAQRLSPANDPNDPNVLLRLDMNSALELLALPAAGARVVRIERRRGAGLAADTGIAQLVERQERDVVILCVLPDVARVPAGNRRHARDGAVRQLERLDFPEIRA